MNERLIRSYIKHHFDKFCNSIEDEEVKNLVKNNTIVSGGAIVSLLLNDKPNDFDCYFTNKETAFAVTKYYVDLFNKNNPKNIPAKIVIETPAGMMTESQTLNEGERIRVRIKSSGVVGENTDDTQYEFFETVPMEQGEEYLDDVFEDFPDIGNIQDNLTEADEIDSREIERLDDNKKQFRPIFLSDNAITLSDKFQLIIRFYGPSEEIHKNYDFVHCTNYWESRNNNLVLKKEALESLITKQLYYVGSKYPLCSIIRLRKFMKRGWHINAGEILKICLQLNEFDLNDLKVLEDQLTGVDTYYFRHMLNVLKEKRKEEKSITLDYPYVVSIIDKLF